MRWLWSPVSDHVILFPLTQGSFQTQGTSKRENVVVDDDFSIGQGQIAQ